MSGIVFLLATREHIAERRERRGAETTKRCRPGNAGQCQKAAPRKERFFRLRVHVIPSSASRPCSESDRGWLPITTGCRYLFAGKAIASGIRTSADPYYSLRQKV